MLSKEIFKHLGIDDSIQHHGIKGMRWGVMRNRNRPGGADGKEESEKVKDKRSTLTKNLDSMKRERQWNKVLKNVNKLNTTEINAVTKRIKLENSLKTLSKSKVGSKKDREDYLRRANMSDAELNRKVVRLRAKESLRSAVKDASKEQRDFGEKVVRVGSSLSVKYALKKSLGPKDFLDAFNDPKEASKKAKEDVLDNVNDPVYKKSLENILKKIDPPKGDKKK